MHLVQHLAAFKIASVWFVNGPVSDVLLDMKMQSGDQMRTGSALQEIPSRCYAVS